MLRFRPFIGSQVIVGIGQWTAHLLNIAFYLFAALLAPAQFSEVVTILSLALLFGVGQTAMQDDVLLLRREGARLPVALRRSLSAVVKLSLLLTAVTAAASPLLRDFFHFPGIMPFLLLGCGAGFHLFTGVAQGALLARGRFVALAASLVSVTAGRLPLGYLFFRDGYQSTDASWIIFFSGAAMFLVHLWMVRDDLKAAGARSRAASYLRRTSRFDLASIIASTLLLAIALRVDVLWAKHALPATEAGVYGILSTIAVFLFYATSSVARTSLSYLNAVTIRRLLLWCDVLIAAAAAGALLLFGFAGDALIGGIFGAPYAGHLPALLLLLIAASCYALIHVSSQYMRVLDDRGYVALSVGLVLTQGGLFLLFGSSIERLALAHLGALLLFALLFLRRLLAQHHPGVALSFPSVVHGAP